MDAGFAKGADHRKYQYCAVHQEGIPVAINQASDAISPLARCHIFATRRSSNNEAILWPR